jgi:hypothetical protein
MVRTEQLITQLIESMPMVHVTQSDKWAAKHGRWKPELLIGYTRK